MAGALEVLRERGSDIVAVEAGPHVFGSMLGDGLIDELFLTLSPVLARPLGGPDAARDGRGRGAPARRSHRRGQLLGARRSGAHLFLHYALGTAAAGRDP